MACFYLKHAQIHQKYIVEQVLSEGSTAQNAQKVLKQQKSPKSRKNTSVFNGRSDFRPPKNRFPEKLGQYERFLHGRQLFLGHFCGSNALKFLQKELKLNEKSSFENREKSPKSPVFNGRSDFQPPKNRFFEQLWQYERFLR